MTQDEKIAVLVELVNKQDEYISFLNDKNEEPISIAFAHGWRCSGDAFHKGESYREEIRQLKGKFYEPKNHDEVCQP